MAKHSQLHDNLPRLIGMKPSKPSKPASRNSKPRRSAKSRGSMAKRTLIVMLQALGWIPVLDLMDKTRVDPTGRPLHP